MIEEILLGSEVAAIIIRHGFHQEGIQFFTKAEDTMQLGYMFRPKGYKIAAHIHMPVDRVIEYTKEVIYVKSGAVKVNFYDQNQNQFNNTILKAGDVILLSIGGHDFEMLEASEMIEMKQGPYAGENDKIRF